MASLTCRVHTTPARRSLAALAVTSALLFGACGDDSGSTPTATDTATTAEEGHAVVPDAQVTSGLAATRTAMDTLVTVGAADEATFEKDVHEGWESYEGTVKQNDSAAYLAMEDALSSFQQAGAAKDPDTMKTAAEAFGRAADGYLAKYP